MITNSVSYSWSDDRAKNKTKAKRYKLDELDACATVIKRDCNESDVSATALTLQSFRISALGLQEGFKALDVLSACGGDLVLKSPIIISFMVNQLLPLG